jgi:phosphotriesterase-related protein
MSVTPQPRAVSVLGPLDPDALGTVMPREMVIFDNLGLQVPPSTLALSNLRDAQPTLDNLADLRANPLAVTANLRSPAPHVLEAELKRLAVAASPCTVVEVTAYGRDPAGLVALARRTGVHIIFSAGRSCEAAAAAEASVAAAIASGQEDVPAAADTLAQQLVNELTAGVAVAGEGGVCAGVIGELPGAAPPRGVPGHEAHATLLRAAAIAQIRTGAPIWCALAPPAARTPAADAAAADATWAAEAAEAALAAARCVCAHGGDARRLVLNHAQHLLGSAKQLVQSALYPI